MTSPDPFAEAVVQARLEWGDLDGEFEARVRAATEKAAQAARKQLARIQLAAKIKLNPDVTALRAAVREIKNLHVDVQLRTNAAEVRRFTSDLNQKLKARNVVVHVQPNFNEEAFRERIRNLPEGRVNVNLTVTNAELRRFVTNLNDRLAAANIRVPVGLDINEAAYRARLEALTRPVTQTVNINTNGGGASGGLSSLNNSLDGTNSRGRKLRTAGIAGLIAAIGGAAGIAAGAVGALAAGLGAVGIAGGAGLATAVVGMQGIGDAFSAFSDQTASAGADAKAQAKAVEAAAKQMESAEKAVARANKGSLDAQKDLNQARKDATRSIEDVNFALKGTAIDEKDAALALARAREAYDQTFSDPTATGLDRAEAALGIDKALRRQDEVARRNNDLIAQAAEANAKGVEGSDEVVAAKEKVVEADERVAEANEQLVEATEAMNDALNGTTDAADKVAEALAKLSPNARAFVLAMRDLGPAWKDLKLSVQDAMFADLDRVFTNLANATLPTLKTGMTEVGGAINGAAKEFAAFWGSAEAQNGIRDIFAGTSDFITALQPGLRQASEGILAIGTAARPVMDEVGASIGGLIGNVMQAFTDAANSGALTQLISTFADIMDGFGEGLNGLLDGLIEFGNIVGPVIGPLLKSLGEGLGALAPSLGALGASFGQSLITLMPFLVNFISALADGLVPVMPVLATLFAALGTALTPLIGPLSDILVVIGQALVEAIAALAPAIGPLGEAFAALIEALAPLLPMAADVISTLVQALAPALTTIFEALGPVIELWLEGMRPAMEQLAPILADVAMQLGTAIADALVQITPLLPTLIDSFSRIILALAPFIPQLVQISADLLPVVIDLFMVLVETVLPPLTSAIEFIARYVLPLVVEGIRSFAQEWSDRLTDVKTNMQGARDFISGATESITSFFTGMGDKISSVWDSVVSTIRVAVGKIGKLLQDVGGASVAGFRIPGASAVGALGDKLVNWSESGTPSPRRSGGNLTKVPGRAQGGVFKGAGGPTDDANLIRISNKEHLAYVTRAQAVSGTTLPLLDAINNGWVPPADFLHGMVPGFRNGGLVTPDQLNRFATQLEGKEYVWGGVNWGDCSGAMSALANYTAGNDPFGSRFATGNMAESLAAMGAIPGLGPSGSFNLGWFNGGPYGGHTAGTLPNGVNVEMGGARGDGQYGGGAAGADDPSFTDHAHFPPEFFLGGDPTMSGATTGTGARKGGITGTVKGGGSTSSSGGGGGGGSLGGGGTTAGGGGTAVDGAVDAGYGATDVFVTNWPSDFPVPGGDTLATTASDAAAYTVTDPATGTTAAIPMGAVPGATSRMGGFDPTYYGDTAPYGGIAGANDWAARQDFQSQFNSWGIDALKEIGGELFSPLGLESAWGSLVDRGASELARMGAPASSQAGEYQQVVFNNSFVGMDPNKVSAELERQFQPGTAVAGRYRGN
ncbi:MULTISPECIES: phage tail protein [unclassified Rhodococcus (in: high G+C Gram-positive bacteria)]|uniref:phage tail protein n=1 Tax=unclassified Rhodococcus (in: high G+C Gram-positive bacteria) TaxID=192944 RepID=UPI000B9B4BB6|nr:MULTISPECIES: hypothetical protein [unclassified Rhodococcus (in: high G+C Gram-positive bacteria)]